MMQQKKFSPSLFVLVDHRFLIIEILGGKAADMGKVVLYIKETAKIVLYAKDRYKELKLTVGQLGSAHIAKNNLIYYFFYTPLSARFCAILN